MNRVAIIAALVLALAGCGDNGRVGSDPPRSSPGINVDMLEQSMEDAWDAHYSTGDFERARSVFCQEKGGRWHYECEIEVMNGPPGESDDTIETWTAVCGPAHSIAGAATTFNRVCVTGWSVKGS